MHRGFTLTEPSHAVAQSPRRRGSTSAFTLIELSIVLVIIGLVVGGVLVGQDLIKAAALRSMLTQRDQFETATMTFKLKYNGLPGDMANATQFFGTNSNSVGSVPSNAPPETGTFNGDGNGIITPRSYPHPIYPFQETGAYWQQLASAGLISGIYNGANGYNGDLVSLYSNLSAPNDLASPKSKIANDAWWSVKYIDAGWLSYTATAGVAEGHMLVLGGAVHCGSLGGGGPEVLTVGEMVNIESKIDDGLPNSGKVIVPNSNGGQGGSGCHFGPSGVPCITQSATTWSYNMPSGASHRTCMPVFRMEF